MVSVCSDVKEGASVNDIVDGVPVGVNVWVPESEIDFVKVDVRVRVDVMVRVFVFVD